MKKMPVIIIATLVAVVALIIIVASSGKKDSTDTSMSNNQNTSNSAPSGAIATDKVDISNYMFGPADIKVKVGTNVTWTNHDSVSHSVASDDGKMPSSKLFAKDQTYIYTFTKAGVYKYHCSPHPYMHGSVLVENN